MKPPERSPRFYYWAPATLFVCVAAVHLTLAATSTLIPWFGGGFGMFATFDQPWQHALSIEARDGSGNRYVVDWSPPASGDGPFADAFKSKLLSLPDKDRLSEAAQVILHARLSPVEPAPQRLLQALGDEHALERVGLSEPAQEFAKVRALETRDSSIDLKHANPLVWVRLRVWRLHFDTAQARVYVEPAGEPFEATRP